MNLSSAHPEQSSPHGLGAAIGAAREEMLLMLALWACAFGIRTIPKDMASPDLTVWLVSLLIQSIPYAAALLVSMISAFNLPATLLGKPPQSFTPDLAPE